MNDSFFKFLLEEYNFNYHNHRPNYGMNGKVQTYLIRYGTMYPRVYNSFYKKINIIQKPSFNLRVFFSGSIVLEGYNSFKWDKDPKKFPNRINVINN